MAVAAIHILIASSAAVAADMVEATASSCIKDPMAASCKAYKYPNATIDLDKVCGMGDMGSMSGCSVHKRCSIGGASGAVCDDFELLLAVCDPMPGMMPCKNAMSICQNGTAVAACSSMPQSLVRMPSAGQAKMAALRVCTEMPKMAACPACTAASCPDPLLSLSKLCQAMPAMDECAGWEAWCVLPESSDELPAYCSGAPPPGGGGVPMRMYFHTDWRDYILFESWVPDDARSYFVSLVAVLCMGVMSAWLRGVRAVAESYLARMRRRKGGRNDGLATLRDNAVRALLVSVSTALDYLLMLIAMTYNVGLFTAVIVGLGIGTLGFGHWGRTPLQMPANVQEPFLDAPARDDDGVSCH